MQTESIILKNRTADKNAGQKGDRDKVAPKLKKWAPVTLLVIALGSAWGFGWFDYLTLSNLIKHRMELMEFVVSHLYLGLLTYILIYAALVAISFPGASLLTIISGFLFGGILAGIATIFAATMGAVVIFLIARSSFGSLLAKKTGPFIKKMVDGFQQDAFEYLLMIRLTPVFPFWVVNIVPALLNMRVLPYAIATFIGIIPGTFAYAFIGAGLDSIIAAQEAANPGCAEVGTCQIDVSALLTPGIIIAMFGLAFISILPVIIKRVRRKKVQV